ncbi:IMP dehydrogenase [Pontiella sulfatireligans]|uniref:Inosine-5'-monophosphate dehydrogenase n=1 Tax=Pontiella sulfatireligans TaxID=2750658 RepID=A0A6C2UR76_9BACT|nr:IMP dehydrogenase [Pontiella sulfatireligans]VGO22822.1 Inosine-5'-monophosphate dehydrogenase [Pontiella sulfatireligans]
MSQNQYINDFMKTFPHEGLTFDDVSLITQYADFLPGDTEIGSNLTRNVAVKIPFLSAAMDTVTEAHMAISMAMMGGIGVIHKNLDPEEQALQVSRVKHHLNGLISAPITVNVNDTLESIAIRRAEKGYSFSGFPILDDEGKLIGILTSKDIRFARSKRATVTDIMTSNVITAKPDTNLRQAYDIMQQHKIGKLPLLDNTNKLVGLYSYADVRRLVENEEPLFNRDDKHRLRVAAGIGPGDYERAEVLNENEVDVLVVDTAHGHSKGVIDMVAWVKNKFPHIDVIGGNIATGEAALALRDAGADAVKVGIGPGSICTTRVVAGVGIPQISAIYAAASALKGDIPVIADGGIRNSGDIAKALVAGADTVMMGSVLAGTEESPGEKIIFEGRQFVVYRGMGSLDAMKSREGSRQRYGLSSNDDLVPQGIEGMVPFAGTVSKVMKQYCGGLQASLGYCGARNIAALKKKGQFVRVSGAGAIEAHAHDIKITKEAPNYRR